MNASPARDLPTLWHGAVGADILGADDITDDVAIVIRRSWSQKCSQQRDVIGDAIRRDYERINRAGARDIGVAGVAGGEGRVEHIHAVTDRVADVNVRKAREEADPQAAPGASWRASLCEGRRRAEEKEKQSREQRHPNEGRARAAQGGKCRLALG